MPRAAVNARRDFSNLRLPVLAFVGFVLPLTVAALSGQEIEATYSPVAKIDNEIRAAWKEYDLSPSPRATDGEWCRRAFLDVLGRIPTIGELREFTGDKSAQKREQLVDRLLFGERYAGEYARNWSVLWTNTLIGRSGGTENRSFISREGMQKYLRDCFAANKPFDGMVRELISATGNTVPGSQDFNGATNFLVMKLEENAVQATAKTAQVFLGLQVQCTQCHNHPFNNWKQNQFWELNAFYRQTVALRRFEPGTNDIRTVELANQDFGGEGSTPEEAETYYELRNGLLKVAYPVFVDGTPLANRSGYLSDVNRREELAKLIVASDYLQAALVNRMWGHFFGYGFTKPVDDMGPHNPPTHPALLEYLGDQFRRHGCDLKQLIRWIALSEPYALSSRTTKSNAADDPTLGERPKFSHFYLRQMRAEELYESLLVATRADKARGDAAEQERTRRQWLRQFTIVFGTDEGDETTTFNGTIPQALMMFNGELTRQATNVEQGSFLAEVAGSGLRPDQKIEHLFLTALARKPTKAELHAANQLLVLRQSAAASSRPGRRPNARGGFVDPTITVLQDIWWAVLNSNEFILNH